MTASEDGSVMFWDQREKNASFTLEPYKHASINRPNFGHWVGSASINNEWLITGELIGFCNTIVFSLLSLLSIDRWWSTISTLSPT